MPLSVAFSTSEYLKDVQYRNVQKSPRPHKAGQQFPASRRHLAFLTSEPISGNLARLRPEKRRSAYAWRQMPNLKKADQGLSAAEGGFPIFSKNFSILSNGNARGGVLSFLLHASENCASAILVQSSLGTTTNCYSPGIRSGGLGFARKNALLWLSKSRPGCVTEAGFEV